MLGYALALALTLQDSTPAPEDTAPPAAETSSDLDGGKLVEPETVALPVTPEPAPATEATAAPEVAVVEDRIPKGAPREDYPFVAWCYGALRGYLDLHDTVMPEVTRIESTYRKPGSRLEDDLKVYDDMQADGQTKLVQFQSALTAAEKASVRPINVVGANAVRQGRSIWANAASVSKARLAQEWMSWTLPARCEVRAAALETRALLAGAALNVNQTPQSATTEPAKDATLDTPAEATASPGAEPTEPTELEPAESAPTS